MQTQKKGFTLIELLVVIVIIGILAAIGVPQFTGYFDKARDAERSAAVGQIGTIVKVNVAASADGSVTYDNYTTKALLDTALSTQGYVAPSSSNSKCFVYAYNATDFYISAGLEETAGTISVSGTGAGTTEANVAAVTTVLAADHADCTAAAVATAIDAVEVGAFTYVTW